MTGDPQAVRRGVRSSVLLVAMVIPGVETTNVVASIALDFITVFENIFEVESKAAFWSSSTARFTDNFIVERINWCVSLSGRSK